MSASLAVDHAVVNVLHDMDAAAARFAALGFTLTPRSRHSLGSINHLMVFEHDYLELVGLPADGGAVRREIAESPVGLNGLVFATRDAAGLQQSLAARAIPAQPPLDFDRPVEVDGTTQRAAFRTVRLDPGYVHGGRVYFCEHRTPELVWRPAWQAQPNGVHALAGMTIAVPDPEAEAAHYRALTASVPPVGSTAPGFPAATAGDRDDGGREDGDTRTLVFGRFALRLTTPVAYRERYGALACDASGRDAFMGALALRTRSLGRVRDCIGAASLTSATRQNKRSIAVAASAAFNTVLEFEV